jgi:hypothetical protein
VAHSVPATVTQSFLIEKEEIGSERDGVQAKDTGGMI